MAEQGGGIGPVEIYASVEKVAPPEGSPPVEVASLAAR